MNAETQIAKMKDRYSKITRLFCHSEYLGKKIKDIEYFDWNSVDLIEVVGETTYPEPKS